MIKIQIEKGGFFFKALFCLTLLVFICETGYAGTISGTVNYEGKAPKMKPIRMDADPICASKHQSPVLSETLVLGEGNTMANVFVHVKSGLDAKEYPVPEDPVVIDQKGCKYTPHVFGIQVGQTLEILNPDGTLHNVHALCQKNTEFNMAMPKFKKKARKKFAEEEFMFPIKCDVHPWMKSWCAVMSHPYFSVSGKDGGFQINDLGPGTYEIEAWHEKLGTRQATVTVSGDETQTADFTFSRPTKK